MAYLEFRNIFLNYDQRTIFSGFNLEIERQEKVLLCAPSGGARPVWLKCCWVLWYRKPGKSWLTGCG